MYRWGVKWQAKLLLKPIVSSDSESHLDALVDVGELLPQRHGGLLLRRRPLLQLRQQRGLERSFLRRDVRLATGLLCRFRRLPLPVEKTSKTNKRQDVDVADCTCPGYSAWHTKSGCRFNCTAEYTLDTLLPPMQWQTGL